jgi:hypothetical protein
MAVGFCHLGEQKGLPRFTELRSASTSASVYEALRVK